MSSIPFIFKNKLVEKRLEHFTSDSIPNYDAKLAEIRRWYNATAEEHLDRTKETDVQGAFMTRLFGQVFGYLQIMDDGNCYTQESEFNVYLDTSASDGALGFFYKDSLVKDVRVVIELKDARTDLDKKQNRKNHLTPVEQAFSYANKNGSKCQWVIVSNFKETRLYRSTSSIEYETFDMRKMNDANEFIRFYYFMCKENLISEVGKSVIDELYLQNEAEGLAISNKFYGQYNEIRNNLFSTLKENNPEIDDLTLFTKSQKLMDRFIFICFCEDCDLLPQNVYAKLIEAAKSSYTFSKNKLWDQLKGLFSSIDQGNSPMRINQYNGGLFKADKILDALSIPDDILESFTVLSEYDFTSDLNVNILGQIFEQSISDVEEIKNEISGVTNNNSKQKEDGIFYTPYYVTRYIVEQTVGVYLEDKREAIKKELFANGPIAIKSYKLDYTGKGNKEHYKTIKFKEWEENIPEDLTEEEDIFLYQQALNKLHLKFYEKYEEVLKNLKICDPSCGSGAFLTQCLDYLHEEMDFILNTKDLLTGGQFNFLDINREILQNNLYGVDINPESVEITKLSLWLKTAKNNQTLATLDGNIKCGNSIIPDSSVADNAFDWAKEFPDVYANGGFDIIIGNPPYGAKLDVAQKKFIKDNYDTAEGRFDTYHTFIELGMKLLKPNGYLGYITPNTYLILEEGTVKLRKYLFDNYTALNFVELYNVFPNAVVEPIISIYYKGIKDQMCSVISIPRKTALSSTFINEGITTLFTQENLKEKEGYIFNYRENDKDKALKAKIRSGSSEVQDKFKVSQGVIPYGQGEGTPAQTKQTVDEKPFTGFEKLDETWVPFYKGIDINRYTDDWTGEWIKWGVWLCRPRRYDTWAANKLLVRQTGDYPIATYVEGFIVAKDSIHAITVLPENKTIQLKYLLGLLNSKMMKWIFRSDNFHIVGKPLAQTKAIYIKKLPLKVSNQDALVQLVDDILKLNKTKVNYTHTFLSFLHTVYGLKGITANLREFYLYDFTVLLSELKKQKIKLSGNQKIELMEAFNSSVEKINGNEANIRTKEDAINTLVYEIFGLDSSDIEYIEQNL